MHHLRRLLRGIPLLWCMFTLLACGGSVSLNHFTFTLTWHTGFSGFPDVSLSLTPKIPPLALDKRPSSYVKIGIRAGSFSFSTDDPAYKCLESSAIVATEIYAPVSNIVSGNGPGSDINLLSTVSDFLVAYHDCGLPSTSQGALVSLPGGLSDPGEKIYFEITGQRLVSTNASGQQLTPFWSTPHNPTTPTQPSITPTTPVAPVVKFQASLTPNYADCVQAPGSSKLILDNRGSSVDVSWQISFEEQNVSKSGPWGIASPASNTVPAGQIAEVLITPSADLCQASTQQTYHLDVNYTVNGVSQSARVVSYTVAGTSG